MPATCSRRLRARPSRPAVCRAWSSCSKLNVQGGDRVRAGMPLMDGPSNPHDVPASPTRVLCGWGGVLSVLGEKGAARVSGQ